MTSVDAVRFSQSFNRLAVALRLPADQTDEVMQRVYWSALEDMPIDFVERAAESMAKTAQWFPKTSEWRDAANEQRLTDILALPEGREEPWHSECGACDDTGWEEKRCYPGTGANCGRPKCVNGRGDAKEHTYVYKCSCRETNATWIRHHRVPTGRETRG